jgi:hypothetical protein
MVLHPLPLSRPAFFDVPHLVVGTRDQFKWLYGVIEAIVILNLLDAVLTIFWVHTGIAREANPLLQPLVHNHVLLFIAIKIALGSLGTWLLWEHRHRAFVVIGTFSVFMAYYAVLLQHLRIASFVDFFI